MRLYNQAEITYQDMKLSAGLIVLDYSKNEVYAGRIKDALGNLVQKPNFIQGRDEVNPDSIRFNFDTKSLIWNSKTAQGGMNVFSSYTKNKTTPYYIKNAKVTTASDPENPDYYIRIRKGKLIPGGKIIAGFSNLCRKCSHPVFVPLLISQRRQKRVWPYFPTFGESRQRGYYLQNLGYYLPISEYLDINLTGDYYTNASYALRWQSSYKRLYKYSGNLSVRFEKLVSGQRGFDDYSKSTVYNVRWNHRQDQKLVLIQIFQPRSIMVVVNISNNPSINLTRPTF